MKNGKKKSFKELVEYNVKNPNPVDVEKERLGYDPRFYNKPPVNGWEEAWRNGSY